MVSFGSPFRLPVEDLFRVISLLSCGVDNEEEESGGGGDSGSGGGQCGVIRGGSGGIETLILDVDLNMHDILDELFPPADKAWKNLRKIHIMSSWTDVEQLMTHLYKRG